MRDLTELLNQLSIGNFLKSGDRGDSADLFHYRASAIGELLTIWHQDPRYLNQKGEPVALRMNGQNCSFSKLAAQAAPKLDARKVLSELKLTGAVTTDNRGYIRATTRSLSVYEDRRLAIQHTLGALSGFIKTLRHNLESAASNSEQLFHRVAWNGQIDLEEIPKLKIWLKNRGQVFLESADKWMQRRSNVKKRGDRNLRSIRQVSVGLYLSVDQ